MPDRSAVHLRVGQDIFLIWFANLSDPCEKDRPAGPSQIQSEFISGISGKLHSLASLATAVNNVEQKFEKRLSAVTRELAMFRVTAAITATLLIGVVIRLWSGLGRGLDMSKWRKCDSAATLILALFAVVAGVVALVFAACENKLGAIVALILSLFCGGLSTGLMALRYSSRRTQREIQTMVVDRTLTYLLKAVETEPTSEDQRTAEPAELVDRLHRLALKALDGS